MAPSCPIGRHKERLQPQRAEVAPFCPRRSGSTSSPASPGLTSSRQYRFVVFILQITILPFLSFLSHFLTPPIPPPPLPHLTPSPPPSLPPSTQVCRPWQAAASSPSLWRQFPLTKKASSLASLERSLSLPRLSQLQHLQLVGDWEHTQLFPASSSPRSQEGKELGPEHLALLQGAGGLQHLSLQGCDLRRLEAGGLGRLVGELRGVTVTEARVTAAQVTKCLFTRLESLDLARNGRLQQAFVCLYLYD